MTIMTLLRIQIQTRWMRCRHCKWLMTPLLPIKFERVPCFPTNKTMIEPLQVTSQVYKAKSIHTQFQTIKRKEAEIATKRHPWPWIKTRVIRDACSRAREKLHLQMKRKKTSRQARKLLSCLRVQELIKTLAPSASQKQSKAWASAIKRTNCSS